MIYSYFYISPYFKPTYFLALTVLFVASMCLVISMSNLFFIMLGWDGLGLVSFFLIVFYQNQSSIFSGVFTLLINRVGDAFFLCSIALYLRLIPDYFVFNYSIMPFNSLIFLLVTFITKRAIYPFSPWLPIAIAAPTPISALVHSSTLVTSGLFLIMKFSYLFYSSTLSVFLLLLARLFTSFYAGLNTVFEKDLKKLIALSTLRHLGFIGFSFSLGLLSLSFFHLLSHALFKSLLFIAIGDIMIGLGHSQDIRYLSSGFLYTPFSSLIMSVSLFNLAGIPSLVGYFSKDLVLETTNYSSLGRFCYFILIINLLLTFYYTFQLVYYSVSFNKFCSYSLFSGPIGLHSFLLLVLASLSLVFGYVFLFVVLTPVLYLPLPLSLKLLPVHFLIVFLISISIFLRQFTSNKKNINQYFSSIIFLYFLKTKAMRSLYYYSSFYLIKSFELGFLNFFLNTKLPQRAYFLGLSFFRLSLFPPLAYTILVSLFFFFILGFVFVSFF